jgi:hypothetical protein
VFPNKNCLSRDGILGHQFNKDSSLWLHAIHSPFYWRILKKTTLFFGFKNTKKIRETRKLEYIHEKHFVEQKNEDRKPQIRVYAQEPRPEMPFKNTISVNGNIFELLSYMAGSRVMFV